MSLLNEAKDQLGELFLIGFSGLEISAETASFLTKNKIGGVLYFSRNYETPEQLAQLSVSLQALRPEAPLWISADYEGGRVQRFKAGFTRIPPPARVAEKGESFVFEVSSLIAQELQAVGINLNFAPVADILTNPSNPVIGDRAFGNQADSVSLFVEAFIRGHSQHGLASCAKHFPGHGDTHLDSHFDLPSVSTPLETLKQREWLPFLKAIQSGCPFVMTSHVLHEGLDAKNPATLSRFILDKILREGLGFKGCVISDDMNMKAISDHFGEDEAPIRAIEAGCDLLIYSRFDLSERAYAACQLGLDSGALSPERVLSSASHLRALKQEWIHRSKEPYNPSKLSILSQKSHLDLVQGF